MTADLPVEEPFFDETQKAAQKLKTSKARHAYIGIITEHLQYGGNALYQPIHKPIILIWIEEKFPTQWKKSIIVFTKKKR